MQNIYLSIPRSPEYFSSVRLFTSGILSGKSLDIEKIEDVKMALSEGLNIAYVLECKDNIDIEYEIDENRIKINIDRVCKDDIRKTENLELSSRIIDCLVDDFYIQDEVLTMIVELEEI